MARMHHWIALSLLGISLTGCVAQEKYNALKLDRDTYASRLAKAEMDAQAARSEAEAYRNQYGAVVGSAGNQNALVANLTQQQIELQKSYDELNRRYEEAVRHTGTVNILPVELNKALQDFAAANPDIVDFDSSRGIVKFKSDVTFNTGSDEITAKAREPIDRFASILNSPAAASYELQVAGHTDSSPVVNQETVRRGHKDNWYLSAHRAIAVSRELQSQNVSPSRIEVAGYADQHPVASNASEQGKAQNRRVEVLILPSQARSIAQGGSRGAPRPAAKQGYNKDTVGVDRTPVINK